MSVYDLKPCIIFAGARIARETFITFHIFEEIASFGVLAIVVLFHPIVELHFIFPFRDDRTEKSYTREYV